MKLPLRANLVRRGFYMLQFHFYGTKISVQMNAPLLEEYVGAVTSH